MKKIAVFDSGLGGISVQAMLDKFLRTKTITVEFSFFNLYNGTSYNQLSEKEAIMLFDTLFRKMIAHQPNKILIACNTLSILFPLTPISKEIKIPILGIIDIGIQAIVNYTQQQKNSTIVILGTAITIKSNQHKQKLLELGVAPDTIINQSCNELQIQIQNGNQVKAKEMIYTYLKEAKHKMTTVPSNLALVLGCTHYHFASAIFREAAQDIFGINPTILNPNEAMAKSVVQQDFFETSDHNNITHKVFSCNTFTPKQIAFFGEAIHKDAPQLHQALKEYRLLQ